MYHFALRPPPRDDSALQHPRNLEAARRIPEARACTKPARLVDAAHIRACPRGRA